MRAESGADSPQVILVGAGVQENLSVRILAAVLAEGGYTVAVLPFTHAGEIESLASQIHRLDPDLLGLSMTFQVRAGEFLHLIKRCRELGYRGHITAGGHFATFCEEEILGEFPNIDSLIRHEGEETLFELVRHITSQRPPPQDLPGLTQRSPRGQLLRGPPRSSCTDLDRLPFPLRPQQAARVLGIPEAPLTTIRGCYAACAYCSIRSWQDSGAGRAIRARSPRSVADEMEREVKKRGVRLFHFLDDNFFALGNRRTRSRLEGLAEELEGRRLGRIAITAKCRPTDVDEELFTFARDRLGLIFIYNGIENASQRGLEHLNRRVSLEDNRRSLEVIGRLGIATYYNLLIFEPDTILDDIDENLAFMEAHGQVAADCCRTEIYTGTELERRLAEQDRLKGDFLRWDYDLADPRVELLFRLWAVAFRSRTRGPGNIVSMLTTLAFRNALLRHFYPSGPWQRLQKDSQEIIRAVNKDNLLFWRHLVDLARRSSLEPDDGTLEVLADLTLEMQRRDSALTRRVALIVGRQEAVPGMHSVELG